MSVLTMVQLRTIMREAAGEIGVGEADVAGTSYLDLGYDSLAMLEISARIKQGYGIQVPDAAIAVTASPATTLAAVNELLAAVEVPA